MIALEELFVGGMISFTDAPGQLGVIYGLREADAQIITGYGEIECAQWIIWPGLSISSTDLPGTLKAMFSANLQTFVGGNSSLAMVVPKSSVKNKTPENPYGPQ